MSEQSGNGPANPLSLWRRVLKPAGTAFGIGSFVGVASFYSVSGDLPFLQRTLLAFLFSVFLGLLFAFTVFVFAAVFYSLKKPDSRVRVTSKADSATEANDREESMSTKLAWGGIALFFLVIWVIGKFLPSNETHQANRSSESSSIQQTKLQSEAASTKQPTELEVLKTAAEKGNASDQYHFGRCYENSLSLQLKPDGPLTLVVPKNYEEAFKWYRKSAERGYVFAQFQLAEFYQNGRGVTQDYAEAIKWYRKAAEQDFSMAQAKLGSMLYLGLGFPQNYLEAFRWYRNAAEHGSFHGQLALGGLYESGEGVAKDKVEAYKWYNLAAASGNTVAIECRDRMMQSLSPEQISEGQRRAAAFVPLKAGGP
jgi:tetratricopeptide (TPR) repeat protein